MTEEAIEILCDCEKKPDWKHTEGMIKEACRIVSALKLPPNDPLTMEQLRAMNGEPVWLVINNNRGQWAIVIIDHEEFISFICADENAFEFDLYGDNDGVEWSAYRRKPEEGKTSG